MASNRSVAYSGAAWPAYDDEQVSAVRRVLDSGLVNYWTGTEGRDFEREFADYTGVAHAIFVANGTVALEIAIAALELPRGAEVVTSPRSYVASASTIVMNGLRPVFADVDPESGNLTSESIAAAITENTAAVLVVHLGGWPADMPEIRRLCDEHDLRLIEDCSQAHGAMVGGAHVGTFGDVATWSFCQDKIVTTGGEGGMIATEDEKLWRKMWEAKDHGKSWEAVYEREHPPGFRWLHESFGTNARGTEMQAAIGRIQYRRLDQWRKERTANAHALAESLSAIPGLKVPAPTDDSVVPAFYRLYAYVEEEALAPGWDRNRIITEVSDRFGVPIFEGSCSEIYRERAFVDAGLVPKVPLPNAQRASTTSLAFLVHPGLGETDMLAVADAVAAVMAEAVECEADSSVSDSAGPARSAAWANLG